MFNYELIFTFLNTCIFLIFCSFLLFNKNKALLIFNCLLFFASFSLLLQQILVDHKTSIFFLQISLACIAFLPASYLFFIKTTVISKNTILHIINTIIGCAFAGIFLFLNFFVKQNQILVSGIKLNTIIISFLLYFFLIFIIGTYFLLISNKKNENHILIIFNFFLLVLGITLTYLIDNQIINSLGLLLISCYIITTIYAIIKYNLFGFTFEIKKNLIRLISIYIFILVYFVFIEIIIHFGFKLTILNIVVVNIVYLIIAYEINFIFNNFMNQKVLFQGQMFTNESKNIIKEISKSFNLSEIIEKLEFYLKNLTGLQDINFYLSADFINQKEKDDLFLHYNFANHKIDINNKLNSNITKLIIDMRRTICDDEENDISNILSQNNFAIVTPIITDDYIFGVITIGANNNLESLKVFDLRFLGLLTQNLGLVLQKIQIQNSVLNEKVSLIKSITATVFKEIREPLNNIENILYNIKFKHKYLTFIEKSCQEIQEKAKNINAVDCLKYLEFIKTNSEGLNSAINNIQQYKEDINSSINNFMLYYSSEKSETKNNLALKPLIEKILANFSEIIQKNHIQITQNINYDGIIYACSEQIEKIIYYLIDNAIKACKNIAIDKKSIIVSETAQLNEENKKQIILTVNLPFQQEMPKEDLIFSSNLAITSIKKVAGELDAIFEIDIDPKTGTTYSLSFLEIA